MYKYEMHLHTSGCSACAVSTAAQMVQKLYEIGYAGAVFTNHFYHGNTSVNRSVGWQKFVDAFKKDYLEAKEIGERLGVDVLFGIEESYETGKEVLIYGLEPDDFLNEPHFIHMNIAEISSFVRNRGGLTVCAHPFRVRDYIPDPERVPLPENFDGVEIYNHCNNSIENRKAADYAKRYGLAPFSGGDVHRTDGLGFAGLSFEKRITDNKELITEIKANRYKLIVNNETV